jgi:hypothetical protein
LVLASGREGGCPRDHVATLPVHAHGRAGSRGADREHGNGLDAAFGLARPWNGLLLGESLMRGALGCRSGRTRSPDIASAEGGKP